MEGFHLLGNLAGLKSQADSIIRKLYIQSLLLNYMLKEFSITLMEVVVTRIFLFMMEVFELRHHMVTKRILFICRYGLRIHGLMPRKDVFRQEQQGRNKKIYSQKVRTLFHQKAAFKPKNSLHGTKNCKILG